MAKTRDYMDYLDNQIGIAPANSQEEFQAAETIVEVMKDHGIEPTIQEFDTHPLGVLMPNIMALILFLGVLLTGLGGGIRILGLILAILAAVLLELHHSGKDVLANVGPVQRSQNVIGVHRASGENVVKGSRPIVIVAHYDTPRENALFGKAFARYQSTLYKNAYICVVIAAVVAITQVLGFLPAAARVVLWIVGLLACVPILVIAVANIMERFAGCTSGSNDNKASVAAMLSILNQVSPAEDRVDAAAEGKPYARRASEDQKPETVMVPEKPVGVRHGKEVIESLGMLPATCEIVYEEPKLISVPADSQQREAIEPPSVLEAEVPTDDTAAHDVHSQGEGQSGEAIANGQVVPGSPVGDGVTKGEGARDASQTSTYQDNGEYYLDNTGDGTSEGVEYSRISPDSSEVVENETADSDSTLRRESQGGKAESDGSANAGKRAGDNRVKAWFGRLKKRFAHDDNPVQIARGKNKDAEASSSDYSQYETTYNGDDEIDQWSSEETEELRPLTKRDIRGGNVRADRRINADSDTAEHQSLGDLYGLSQDDQDQDEIPDEDASVGSDVLGDASEPESSAEDGFASSDDEKDANAHGTAEVAEAPLEDGPSDADVLDARTGDQAQATDSKDIGAADEAEEASEDSDAGWDIDTPDADDEASEDGGAPDGSDSEESIPEPVTIDTDQPRRRVVQKKSENHSDGDVEDAENESVDEVQATVLPDETDEPDSDEELNWRQPSVEDEEYYEEYPDDYSEDAAQGESHDDEYYDDYDQYDADESYAEEDEVSASVYEEQSSSKGGFRKLVNRIKGAFSRKSAKAASQIQPEQVDTDSNYEAQPGYDTEEHIGNETEDQPGEEQAGDVVAFEEVKSEEYLPSDKDAFVDDVDDDYDFPDTDEGSATAPVDDEEEGSNKPVAAEGASQSSSLRFEEEADDRGDILPKDTTGLDALLDDDYADSHNAPRTAPKPIDDPSWGKSTYEPPVSRASIARRAALLDLPNPSTEPVDPLGEEDDEYENDHDVASGASREKPNDKLGDTAEQKGTEENRRRKWKGGAAVRSDLRPEESDEPVANDDHVAESVDQGDDEQAVEGVEEESPDTAPAVDEDAQQDAILDLGNDLLLSHDVWFVAVGASSVGHAGIKSFLANFRKDIRGAFLVNLDSIGAGVPVVLTREGLDSGKRADRRSLRLFEDTAKDLHVDVQSIDYGWRDTDATPAMRSRVRSITVMGMDENGLPALSHTLNDVPMNVDPKQVSSIVRVVCEFIRRS